MDLKKENTLTNGDVPLLDGASAGTTVGSKSGVAPQLHCNACSQTLILLKCPTFKPDHNV